ncbi:MAG TPA: carboxypeptidase-like regulatory domain-containing protein, partial [Gemmatimonadaceae bacterium]|nr:carboxypeptidase-like regulatory domain-containing protein [Gemmatimonadaceae bacterium]
MRLLSRHTPLANRVAWFVSTTVVVVLTSAIASAQSGRSTISGVVHDTSEGVVARADVIAIQEQTGAVTTSHSGVRGLYALLNLSAGTYTVEFRKAG